MIDMHSKYDNMHKNGMFYALICVINYIITCINCMLSVHKGESSFFVGIFFLFLHLLSLLLFLSSRFKISHSVLPVGVM